MLLLRKTLTNTKKLATNQRQYNQHLKTWLLKRQIHYDVVIVGGGVMGSSSAFFLKHKAPSLNVAVVEGDPKV